MITAAPPLSRHHTLSESQIRIILRLDPRIPMHALLQTSLYLGLRPPEALGLTWDRVRLQNRTVLITQQLSYDRKSGQFLILPVTKTFRPRTIRFGEQMYSLFQTARAVQLESEKEAGTAWNNSLNLVFTDELGQPFRTTAVQNELCSLLQQAGEAKARLYDFRHTAATAVHEETGDIQLAQSLLGHASPDTTKNYYLERNSRSKLLVAEACHTYLKEILYNEN